MGCGPQETFRSCADIQILPHPLLMNDDDQEEFYSQALLENQLASEDNTAELHHQKMASIRRKEALLRRKKLLLKQLIKKLRLLIQESSVTADQETSPQRPMVSQILPPEMSPQDYSQVRPWWDRIMSNKH